MENRVTRLIIPIVIAVVAFMIVQNLFGSKQKTAPKAGPRPIPAGQAVALEKPATGPGKSYEKWFGGQVGEPGFKVVFHELGGAIKRVHLWDYFSEPGKADGDHLYEVIENERGILSFVIEDFAPTYPVKVGAGGAPKRMGDVNWTRVQGTSDDEVVYRLSLANGLQFEKVFRFFKGSRRFQVVMRVRNTNTTKDMSRRWTYRLRGAACLKNPRSEWFMNPAMVFAKRADDSDIAHHGPKKAPDGPDYPDVLRREAGAPIAYAGSSSRFFTCVLYPADDETRSAIDAVEVKSLPFRAGELTETDPFSNVAPILQVTQRIPAIPQGQTQAESELTFNVYLGPKDRDVILADDEFAQFMPVLDLDLSPGCCIPGARPMAKLLLWILRFFHSVIGNWGVAIILLTLLVRASILPVNLRQQKSMRVYGAKMQKLKPEMDSIREKHKKNPQKMNKLLLEFQRKHKLFPPLMGCLPMFLTMPVFIGLFTALRASFDLRHQAFGGWINDLSLPDRLFAFGRDLPLLGSHFNLLPILMAILWAANMFGQPLPQDPQQRSVQRMMRFMPIVMLLFLYRYAAGLALYMVVSALWSFFEMRIVKKKLGPAVAGGMAPMPM